MHPATDVGGGVEPGLVRRVAHLGGRAAHQLLDVYPLDRPLDPPGEGGLHAVGERLGVAGERLQVLRRRAGGHVGAVRLGVGGVIHGPIVAEVRDQRPSGVRRPGRAYARPVTTVDEAATRRGVLSLGGGPEWLGFALTLLGIVLTKVLSTTRRPAVADAVAADPTAAPGAD